MEVIASGSVEKKFNKEVKFSSCSNLMDLLVDKVVKEASDKILKKLFKDETETISEKEKSATKTKSPVKTKSAPNVNYALPLD